MVDANGETGQNMVEESKADGYSLQVEHEVWLQQK